MDHSIKVIPEESYIDTMAQLRARLEDVQEIEHITTQDSCLLFCRRFVNEKYIKNMVIVHGFTEFSEKYMEMIGYFYGAGYNVFIYDQRGHGWSHREVADLKLVHVSSFERYVDDLEAVITNQVQVYGKGETVLFGHSMGGAVVLRYCMRHPDSVSRAILSSPMIAPQTHNIPRGLVLSKTAQLIRQTGETAPFPFAGSFDPQFTFEQAQDQCRPRFEANMALRRSVTEYQSSTATNRWMYEAIKVQDDLLNAKSAKTVQTRFLMLSAQRDRVVKNRLQQQMAELLPQCRRVMVADATHNMFTADDAILQAYYDAISSFLQG